MSLTSLKASRTRYRTLISKEIENSNVLLEDYEGNEIERKDSKKIQLCMLRLKEFTQKLEVTQTSLTALLEKEEKVTDIETFIEEDIALQSKVTDALFELSLLEEDKKAEAPAEDMSQVFKMHMQLQQQVHEIMTMQQQNLEHQQDTLMAMTKKSKVKETSVKLPKLDIPSFSGERLKWSEFWDAFEATIHRNEKLSEIEKLNYLFSKIHGEAKCTVAGLTISKENYEVAVHLLKERFGEKQPIIDSHYTELISLAPATNKTWSLRAIYDKMEKHLRSLESLGQDINQSVFVSIITSKLPKEVLLQLEIQKGNEVKWDVNRLRRLLKGYLSAREKSEQAASETKVVVNMNNDHGVTLKSSAEALFAGTRDNGQRGPITQYRDLCRYCEEKHWSDQCKRYKTIESRKRKIRGCCFLCLRQGHRVDECTRSKTCVYCKKKNNHHRSLCPQQFPSERKESAHLVEEVQDEQTSPAENVLVSSHEMVLMQTATTAAINPNTGTSQEIRVLLDSGSQRTYVTESLAKRLNLKLGEQQEVKLVTFGSNKPKIIKTPTTKIELKLKDGGVLSISANVVPEITGSIVRRPVNFRADTTWKYLLNSFHLADSLPTDIETSTIELLIGNDYYLDVVLPKKIEVQEGLYLLGSKFGWILSGRISETHGDAEPSMLILSHGHDIKRKTTLLSDVDASLPKQPNIEDFWNLETIGIREKIEDKGDEEALNKFEQSVQYQDNRYYVTWPWKEDGNDLPDNRSLAIGRLRSLLRKLQGNKGLMEKYDDIIQEQLTLGIIEKVQEDKEGEASLKLCLTYEQLLTCLIEAEAVINSRPISYVGEDIESNCALTPAHFLSVNPKIGLAHNTPEDNDLDEEYKPSVGSSDRLLQEWKKGQKLLEKFWTVWREDYLLNLRERYQTKLKAQRVTSHDTANVGDVVLVKDNLPRGTWRMGKITELIKSYDGAVRAATVVVSSGKELRRPLNLLYPIECPVDSVTPKSAKCEEDQRDKTTIQLRPQREAAQNARRKIKVLYKDQEENL